ncbi:MAG: hypothetical protein CFE21_06460 [Bacteroidetes bacterium B1(2017)]|nr:MAG: hypothetical protein CFE21_06460 [Bacteroidetes bacterium B1(2017)]
MNKAILPIFFVLLSFVCFGQSNSVAIGEINNGVYSLKDNQRNLSKAFEWTFKDGTKVGELKVEQLGNTYFLVATCSYQGRKRMAAVDIEMVGIEFVLKEESQFKMCSAVACENCRFFLENNKIVACKCEETGTISNHCHYKTSSATSFYSNYQRAIKMNKED